MPNDERRIQGRLTVSENFIDLHLTDPDHHRFNETESLDLQEFPVIFGITQHKEFITLYNCSGYFGDLSAKLMIYGDQHFGELTDLRFRVMSINIPYFDKWLNPGSFQREINTTGFVIKYDRPEKIRVVLDEELELTIEFNCYIPDTRDKNKIILNEYATIQLISNNDEGAEFLHLMKHLTYLQQFASFIFRDGANIDTVRVYSRIEDFSNHRLMGTMIFAMFPFNKFASLDYKMRPLVPFDAMKDNLQAILQKWLNFAVKGQHIIQLILQDYFQRSVFDENRFLNLIRALEVYHGFKFPGTILSPDDFKSKLDAIVENIPEAYKSEVRAFFQFSNDPTLDMRLRALIAETNGIQVGVDVPFDDEFIKKVKWSRNYYTHYNPNGQNKALKGEELVRLTEACRTLINFLLLKHLEISDDILTESFKYYIENSYYSNYFL